MPVGWSTGKDSSFLFSGDLHDSSWGIWWPIFPIVVGGAASLVTIHDACTPASSPRWRGRPKPEKYYGNLCRRLVLPLLATFFSGSLANCRFALIGQICQMLDYAI